MTTNHLFRGLGLTLALVSASGCGDFMKVTNPGLIEDDALSRETAIPGLVGGMSGDLSLALGHAAFGAGLMADELAYAGAYDYNSLPAQGVMTPEFANTYWDEMHRARWVAEQGIERMKKVMNAKYETSAHSARANLLAGFSNRLLGETMCSAVIDGGGKEPHTVHFERAERHFSEAIRLATAAQDNTLRTAALAGRASVRASLGQWTEASADAAQVPVAFVYNATFSTNTVRENNNLVEESRVRFESTVFGTRWASVRGDPRVPWDTAYDAGGRVARGRDGATPVFRQAKYMALGSAIPLAKGTEMLLIRAEAALRTGDYSAAVQRLNDIRAHHRLPEVTAADEASAWALLEREHGATQWLEARRLGTLRRWQAEGRHDFLAKRDVCIPISDKELRSNPNLRGG